MKIATLFACLSSLIALCGCPQTVQTGNSNKSDLSKASARWGSPNVRPVTAGFNGFPSEANDAGPANGPKQ